jgi:hypothetical protein
MHSILKIGTFPEFKRETIVKVEMNLYKLSTLGQYNGMQI